MDFCGVGTALSALHRSQLKSALVLRQTVQREQSCHHRWQARGVTRGQGEAARAAPGAELSQVTPPALAPARHRLRLGWAPSLPGPCLVSSEQHWPSGLVCWELWVVFPKASFSSVLVLSELQEFQACAYVLGCIDAVEMLLAKECWWWQGFWYHFCKVLYLHLRWRLTTCSVHTHHLKRSPAENLPLLLSHKVTKNPAHAFSFKYSLSSPCIIQRNVILWRLLLFNWLH